MVTDVHVLAHLQEQPMDVLEQEFMVRLKPVMTVQRLQHIMHQLLEYDVEPALHLLAKFLLL